MTLDPAYLEYPRRRLGYDHDLYEWSNMHHRKPVQWQDGKSVAVCLCISLEWFPIIPDDQQFRAPGHMVTPYPDYRHYTARDYGNRIGVWRFLDLFRKLGITASFATNAAIAKHCPELIEAVQKDGHEIIAHSIDMNATIDSTMPRQDESRIIKDSIAEIKRATGVMPKGWLSIARSQSWNTPDLLKEHGIKYCCDWVNDELPYQFNNGLVNLPLNHELSDRQIITVQQQSADSWRQSMIDAFDWLASEAQQEQGGRMLPIHITPYIMGLPYRIKALEELLENLTARPEVWFATGGDIVDAWTAQQ